MPTPEEVYAELRQVYDPEIPVNIVDLGLIYRVEVAEDNRVQIAMTLTSQSCPEARTIPEVMRRRVCGLPHVSGCDIEIVWQPSWGPHMISAEGRKILQLDQDEEGL